MNGASASPRILLAFKRSARATYYGDKSLAGVRRLGEVRLNETDEALEGAALIDATRDCDVIVSDRQTAGSAELSLSLTSGLRL